MLAILTIHLHLPACSSLKEKRGRIKPLISRLHREFNVSVAEMDLQDTWQEAVIACAMVNSAALTLRQSLQSVAKWVEANWEDGQIIDEKIEIFQPRRSQRYTKEMLKNPWCSFVSFVVKEKLWI